MRDLLTILGRGFRHKASGVERYCAESETACCDAENTRPSSKGALHPYKRGSSTKSACGEAGRR
jgi:hypothetical protein